MTGYAYIWEFQVKPGIEAEFELHYGPEGTWPRRNRRLAAMPPEVLPGLPDEAHPV